MNIKQAFISILCGIILGGLAIFIFPVSNSKAIANHFQREIKLWLEEDMERLHKKEDVKQNYLGICSFKSSEDFDNAYLKLLEYYSDVHTNILKEVDSHRFTPSKLYYWEKVVEELDNKEIRPTTLQADYVLNRTPLKVMYVDKKCIFDQIRN